MSEEPQDPSPQDEKTPAPGSPSEDGTSTGPELDQLPPPAFPPGTRRLKMRKRVAANLSEGAGGQGEVPDDAFIDPDEPIVRARGGDSVPDDAFIDPDEPVRAGPEVTDDAFIDPDEPIVRTRPPEKPEDFEDVVGGPDTLEETGTEEEVVVTGIGDDAHLDDPELDAIERYGDPHVADLVKQVGALASALRDKGEAGLKTTSDMTRFEATLRAYCTGFLAARREEEE